MSDRMKSIVFALVMCLVCSTLLTAASTSLKPMQTENMQTDRKKNILLAVGILDGQTAYPPSEINRLYKENIYKYYVNHDGTIMDDKDAKESKSQTLLPIYLNVDPQNRIKAYIIPIETRGLWGKIYAYLALADDGSTIDGFTVYKHSETPGLGGEIEKRWFQKNFVGKKIVDRNNHFVSIAIAKGKAADHVSSDRLANYVDGISGATLTGKYLTQGLEKILEAYEPTSLRFRQNILQCRLQSSEPWCENENKK